MNPSSRLTSLIASPAAGFEQPFEMMEACHERMQRTLGLLERLRAHVARCGADEQARQAARDVMRYFDMAAPQHHRDEELHVFPALVSHGDPTLLALVDRLRHDHLQMEVRWRKVRAVLDQLERAESQVISASDAAGIDAFTNLYQGHVAVLLAGYALRLLRRPASQAAPQTPARFKGRKGLPTQAGRVAER